MEKWPKTVIWTSEYDMYRRDNEAFAEKLKQVPDIAVVQLAERDIVRHPLVASMIGVL